jgi:hypothetical protein
MAAPRVQRDYTDTVRDLKSLVRAEADGERREQLVRNLDLMNSEITRLRDKVDTIGALTARVEGLTWLVRSVIVVAVLEVMVGLAVAYILKGH